MKYIIKIIILFAIILVIVGCSDSTTKPNSKRMRIFSTIGNENSADLDSTLASAVIDVDCFPSVSQLSFTIGGENVLNYSSANISNKSWQTPFLLENYYLKGKDSYELKISGNNGDLEAVAHCQIPGKFFIDDSSIPNPINPNEGFTLNWSSSENCSFYTLYYLYEDSDNIVDSLITLSSDTNSFTFSPDIFESSPAQLYFRVRAFESINFDDVSDNNFTGDAFGYFYGSYQTRWLSTNISDNGKSLDEKEISKELKERENKLIRKCLGFN